jgi:hypothetical protein
LAQALDDIMTIICCGDRRIEGNPAEPSMVFGLSFHEAVSLSRFNFA